jgi:hypothetical protein
MRLQANNRVEKVEFKAEIRGSIRAGCSVEAAFVQFWRAYERGFYDPVVSRARLDGDSRAVPSPCLQVWACPKSLRVVLSMMVGELEASHSEVSPRSSATGRSPSTPHLGFTIDYSHRGRRAESGCRA